jgi:hypothetical protein
MGSAGDDGNAREFLLHGMTNIMNQLVKLQKFRAIAGQVSPGRFSARSETSQSPDSASPGLSDAGDSFSTAFPSSPYADSVHSPSLPNPTPLIAYSSPAPITEMPVSHSEPLPGPLPFPTDKPPIRTTVYPKGRSRSLPRPPLELSGDPLVFQYPQVDEPPFATTRDIAIDDPPTQPNEDDPLSLDTIPDESALAVTRDVTIDASPNQPNEDGALLPGAVVGEMPLIVPRGVVIDDAQNQPNEDGALLPGAVVGETLIVTRGVVIGEPRVETDTVLDSSDELARRTSIKMPPLVVDASRPPVLSVPSNGPSLVVFSPHGASDSVVRSRERDFGDEVESTAELEARLDEERAALAARRKELVDAIASSDLPDAAREIARLVAAVQARADLAMRQIDEIVEACRVSKKAGPP